MGMCKTSNFSIFTFIIASNLKFCTRSFSSCVYRTMRFIGSNGKVCNGIESVSTDRKQEFHLHPFHLMVKVLAPLS